MTPHYETARKMLGVVCNANLREADTVLKEISTEFGYGHTFRPVNVGVFFGPEGQDVPDPYFGGEGPPRRGCNFCGACMVGCRYNGKNTLMKNYLYFAEKRGVEVRPEVEVTDIRPLPAGQADGARYEVSLQAEHCVVPEAFATGACQECDGVSGGAGYVEASLQLPGCDPLSWQALASTGGHGAYQQ